MRILTIHKSKGLEFKIVILPFISWKLDHDPTKQPILWVKPESPPFSELGVLPVRYGSDLSETIFADSYREEKYSVYLDNLNLLYVALTRAKDAIFSFSPAKQGNAKTVSGALKQAFTGDLLADSEAGLRLADYYNKETSIFEFGEMTLNQSVSHPDKSKVSDKYIVSQAGESLKLKLHGENYFSNEKAELRKKINYGKIMHEVFESLKTSADVSNSIRKLILEGKVPEDEASTLEAKVKSLISADEVSDWFSAGNEVLTEAAILMPSGNTKRPDRIIFRNGKIILIDFKFGEEHKRYAEQVEIYRGLIAGMGYENIEAKIWYVDKSKIVTV